MKGPSIDDIRKVAKVYGCQPEEANESTNRSDGNESTNGHNSQSARLVQLVESSGAELFHDDERRGYVTIQVDEHKETWPLRRKNFKQWLAQKIFSIYGKAPGGQGLADALNVLEGKAVFDGVEQEVFLRVGGDRENVFLDMGDDLWRMIHITANGWKLVPHSPVKFKRGAGMKALPEPSHAGEKLGKLLLPFVGSINDDDLVLLMGWMVAALRPFGPQLVLEIRGEQGSGKSTLLDLLKEVIDPNRAAKRSEPREVRDLMIAAQSNWVLSLDNLSGVPGWLSDALCRLSTGGAFGSRQLYTDDEEVIFEARRPMILNGIGAIVGRPDLLDRSILLSLPRIIGNNRRSESELWTAFNDVSGKILGSLCDAVVCALKNFSAVDAQLQEKERMADALVWIVAAEPFLGWEPGTFQRAYQRNRKNANNVALEGSLIYVPLCEFLATLDPQECFEISMGDLLERLNNTFGESKGRPKGWPSSPRAMRSALERIAPNLRIIGIEVFFDVRRTQYSRVTSFKIKEWSPLGEGGPNNQYEGNK